MINHLLVHPYVGYHHLRRGTINQTFEFTYRIDPPNHFGYCSEEVQGLVVSHNLYFSSDLNYQLVVL